MKVRARIILARAIEAGLDLGYSRAYKHLDAGHHPTRSELLEKVEHEIWVYLDEVVCWDEDE